MNIFHPQWVDFTEKVIYRSNKFALNNSVFNKNRYPLLNADKKYFSSNIFFVSFLKHSHQKYCNNII